MELGTTYNELQQMMLDHAWATEQWKKGKMSGAMYADFAFAPTISAERRTLDKRLQVLVIIGNNEWSDYERLRYVSCDTRHRGIFKFQPPLFPFINLQKGIEKMTRTAGEHDT